MLQPTQRKMQIVKKRMPLLLNRMTRLAKKDRRKMREKGGNSQKERKKKLYISEFFSERRDPQPTLQSDLLDHKWKWHTTSMTGYHVQSKRGQQWQPIDQQRLNPSICHVDCLTPTSQQTASFLKKAQPSPLLPLSPHCSEQLRSINMEILFLYTIYIYIRWFSIKPTDRKKNHLPAWTEDNFQCHSSSNQPNLT